jgi:hypothetical protein
MTALAEHLVDDGIAAAQALGEAFTHIVGRVVPYNTWTDVGWFLESFQRGAFTGSLVKQPAVPLLLWHDNRAFPVGIAEAWDDRPDGLHGRFKVAMTSVAQVAAQQAREGFLTGMSVGFGPIRSTWTFAADWDPDLGPDHMDRVTRHEARLHEVSLTPTPAYSDAQVSDVHADALDGSSRSIIAGHRFWLAQERRAALTRG